MAAGHAAVCGNRPYAIVEVGGKAFQAATEKETGCEASDLSKCSWIDCVQSDAVVRRTGRDREIYSGAFSRDQRPIKQRV